MTPLTRRQWLGSAAALALGGCATPNSGSRSPANDPNLRLPETAPPGVRYYIIVFGSQSTPKLARYTHTWATVIQVTETDGGPRIEHHTISWMPATLQIRPLRFRPEAGV